MNTDFNDFRDPQKYGRLISWIATNENEIIIPIAHGKKEGTEICNISAEDIYFKNSVELLWFYSCNSANGIAFNTSRKGVNTFGFITEIISGPEIPESVLIARDFFSRISNFDLIEVFNAIRQHIFMVSKKKFSEKKLLDSAILNHTRLSLRCYNSE